MSRTATPCDLVPEAHRVLGTLLRPFSLGHHLLLTKLGSPFAGNAQAEADPDDLALAVFVCAAPYAQHLASQLAGEWENDFARWSQKLRARWWRRTPFAHPFELKQFRAHLEDGYRRAPVCRHLANSIAFTAPWECLIEARLVSGGYPPADVLEMYLPAAWYRYHTFAEIMRADNLTDPSQWRPTFWTAQMAARYRAVPSPKADGRSEMADGESPTPISQLPSPN